MRRNLRVSQMLSQNLSTFVITVYACKCVVNNPVLLIEWKRSIVINWPTRQWQDGNVASFSKGNWREDTGMG